MKRVFGGEGKGKLMSKGHRSRKREPRGSDWLGDIEVNISCDQYNW